MKRNLIILLVLFSICSIQAQPQGGRPGMGGPPKGMNGDHHQSNHLNGKPILEQFPEIPDLTLEQREKIGSILTKEMEDIGKQMDKKREIEKDIREETSDKKREKLHVKMQKSDAKIQDIRIKSDKKVKKILTEAQYIAFVEKRAEFKFKQFPKRPPMENKEMCPPFNQDEELN